MELMDLVVKKDIQTILTRWPVASQCTINIYISTCAVYGD